MKERRQREREEQALALWNALKDREQLSPGLELLVGCEDVEDVDRFEGSQRASGEREKAKEEEPAVADRLASINYHIVVRPMLDASPW